MFLSLTLAKTNKNATEADYAKRAKTFFDWVKKEWDEPGDNIYVWDFHGLETGGGMYMKDKYASDPYDSHPNSAFSKKTAPLFCERIVSIIEGRGDTSSLTGE